MKKTNAISLMVATLLLQIAVCSCRSTSLISIQPELERELIGKQYAEIIETMGAPERTTPDGKNGQILIYEEMKFLTDGHFNHWTRDISAKTITEKGYIHLYLDPTNACYAVKTNMEKEESEFSVGKTVGLIAGVTGGVAIMATVIAILAKDISSNHK